MVEDEFSDGVFAWGAGLNGAFIDEHAVQGRYFQRGVLIEFAGDDGFEKIVDDSGLAFIGTGFGFKAIKAGTAIVMQPGFKSFPVEGFAAAEGDVIGFVRHFLKIAGLALGAFMQNRCNNAVTEQGDLIGVIFRVHRDFSN